MNYQIAIVENEKEDMELLRSHFERWGAENGHTFEIRWFIGGEQFLIEYRPIYDMVLMDIGLNGMNGMETALELRKADPSVLLLFVTNMVSFAVRGYEANAFDFLVKPVSYAGFALKIARAMHQLSLHREGELLIQTGEDLYRTTPSRIFYVEVQNHHVHYHTADGVFTVYGNLKQVEGRLPEGLFVRCNSCYLVNLMHVRKIQGSQLQVGEEWLQISRPKRKAFVQALNDYIGGQH